MATTEISWTQRTWNPIAGCRRVSPGCGGGVKGPDGEAGGCYAETMAGRIVRMGGYEWSALKGAWMVDPKKKQTQASRASADRYKDLVRINKDGQARWTGVFAFDAEKLSEPLRRKAPSMYFVNSMSDLFGEGLTNEQIAAVFGVMAACPQHTFQILTKRAARMAEWFKWIAALPEPEKLALARDTGAFARPWPLPGVWLGVSCERQEESDERIPLLLQCPAAVRWVSAEPLLGPVDFRMVGSNGQRAYDALTGHHRHDDGTPIGDGAGPRLDWIVWGGESGHDARPCEVEWIRYGMRKCRDTGVPAFVKQVGGMPTICGVPVTFNHETAEWSKGRMADKKGADMAEWPEDLRVREWPGGFVPPKSKALPVLP